uniref:Notch ligand N-terminal domain-containing protein n=1 Tax=Romanomermis culicivorax TaxID=13658 RepID=A0A915JPC3_ROMCU
MIKAKICMSTYCETSGVVEIHMFSIENRCGRLSDGTLCLNRGLKTNDSMNCPALCNIFVDVCLQPYDEKVRQPYSWCPYGNGSSQDGYLTVEHHHQGQQGQETGSEDSNFHKPSIVIPFTFAWPVLTAVTSKSFIKELN